MALLALAVLAKVLNAGLVGLAVKTADPEASWALSSSSTTDSSRSLRYVPGCLSPWSLA